MYLDYDNKSYEIVIIRKDNKNTYIRVKDDLKIYVTTNRWASNKSIKKLIDTNCESIISMIKKASIKKAKNEVTRILGREVDVIRLSTQTYPELYNNKFYIKNDNIDKYLKEYAFDVFEERLKIIYNRFEEKIPYPKLKIRKMTTRWGVCNRIDTSVTLNLELIKMDIKYLDYVIVHELSHLIHFNHSKYFWEIVSKYCVNYKELRKEMKE